MDHPLFQKIQREDHRVTGGRSGRSRRIRSIGLDGKPNGEEAVLMYRIGKRTAGRLLDGRTWTQFPVGWNPPPSMAKRLAGLEEYGQHQPPAKSPPRPASFWPRPAASL
jgi:hypothetical protein